jgi:hypothetical protein
MPVVACSSHPCHQASYECTSMMGNQSRDTRSISDQNMNISGHLPSISARQSRHPVQTSTLYVETPSPRAGLRHTSGPRSTGPGRAGMPFSSSPRLIFSFCWHAFVVIHHPSRRVLFNATGFNCGGDIMCGHLARIIGEGTPRALHRRDRVCQH